jgi:hypothetical protein
MKICKLSKILNNKDCELNTKPSYRENLAHVRRIWNAHSKPCPNLDASLRHIEEYKVSIPNNLHTKLCYCMFFNHISKLCHGYEMWCKNLKKHSSLFWMLNQQRSARISLCWQMQSSSYGKVSSLNGRGATSLMDLEMRQHVHQNWLENLLLVAWWTSKKNNLRSWPKGSFQKQ